MFRKLFLMLILLCPITAFAQQGSFDPCSLNSSDLAKLNMSSSQLANLTADCASKHVSANDSMSSVKAVAEHSSEIGEAAKGIAQAIGIAAKELGIAVNDFLKSPAGTLTILFIFAKFFAGKIIGLLLIPLYTVVARGAWTRLMNYEKEYAYTPILWGMFSHKRVTSIKRASWNSMTDSQVFFIGCAAVAYCVAMSLTIAVMIAH